MRLLFLLLLVALLYSQQAATQPGKEDCGPLFDIWINSLNYGMSGTDSVPRDPKAKYFLEVLKHDMEQGRYRILDGEPTDQVIMRSLINTFRQAIKSNRHPIIDLNKEPVAYDEFISGWNELNPGDQYKLSNRSLLFLVADLGNTKDYVIEGDIYFFVNEGDPNRGVTGSVNKLYQYLLDYVEYKRENPAFLDLEYYTLNYGRFYMITGVSAPKPDDTEKVKEYLRIFSKELLFAFGLYIDLHLEVYKQKLINNGPNFSDRLKPGHYRKLLGPLYKAAVNSVIDEIKLLKKNCATSSPQARGEIRFNQSFKDLPMHPKRADVAPSLDPIKEGMGQIAVLYEDAEGMAKNETISWWQIDASGKWDRSNVQRTQTNGWYHIRPGHYKVYYEGLDRRDSIIADVYANDRNIFQFPPKGRLSIHTGLYDLNPSNRYITNMGYWVYKEVPRPGGLYFDTVYLWFNLNAQYGDFHEGEYVVKMQMPPQFFPTINWTRVNINPSQETTVEITGYGSLLVETPNGSGAKQELTVWIMTREKNQRTNEYTSLRRINSYEKLFMRPGLYRLEIGYPVKQVREIEIKSSQPTVEKITNMGSLLVTNGTDSKEWVEIYDARTKRLIHSVRNNVPIDMPAGEVYEVRVRKSGNAGTQTFNNVQLQAGAQQKISW
jgi:hypothetical protein